MTKDEMKACLTTDVSEYAETCQESVILNKHMNRYAGEKFDTETVRTWLTGFVEYFGERYAGSTMTGDVMEAMVEHASVYRKSGLAYGQDTVDAIIVDFVNWVAANRCGMDLALYTIDFKN